MKIKIIIVILIIGVMLSSCLNDPAQEVIPSETLTATYEVTNTPQSTLNVITPTNSPTPTLQPTQTPSPSETPIITNDKEVSYSGTVSKLDVDKSYSDTTVEAKEIVFDENYLYYINETWIVKRSLTSNKAEVIFDEVYDNKYLSIQDGWLYLYSKGMGIIKVKTDGTEVFTIRNVQASKVMVVGDELYYYAASDLMFDWEYHLYKLNLESNENILFRRFGVDALYQEGYLYYSTYDGMKDDYWKYNISAKSDEGYGGGCSYLPKIIDGVAYHFQNGGDYSSEGSKLYIKDTTSNTQTITNIVGSNPAQYYNYLLFKNSEDKLCALNILDDKVYEIMSLEDMWIKEINGDIIYIAQRVDSNITGIYLMDLTQGTEIKKLFNYEITYSIDAPNKDLPKVSELKVDKDFIDIPFALYIDGFTEDMPFDIVYKDTNYSMDSEYNDTLKKTNYFVYDNHYSKQKRIVENIQVVEDMPIFIIINDMIFYTNQDMPGYLYSYDIKTEKTNIYNTGMGVPIRITAHYQYLIIDSYYKLFSFSFLDNNDLSAADQNPIYTVAFNIETGEIVEVSNDILEHPEE